MTLLSGNFIYLDPSMISMRVVLQEVYSITRLIYLFFADKEFSISMIGMIMLWLIIGRT